MQFAQKQVISDFQKKACKFQMPRNLLSSNTGVSSVCLAEIPHKTLHPGILCYLRCIDRSFLPISTTWRPRVHLRYLSFQDNYLPIRQQRYIVQPRVNAIIISLSNTHYHLSMLLCHKGCQQQDLRHLGLI